MRTSKTFYFTFMAQISVCHNLDKDLHGTMTFIVMSRKLKDLSILLNTAKILCYKIH